MQAATDLDTVHVRHNQIDQDEVERLAAQKLKCLFAAGCLLQLVAFLAEMVRQVSQVSQAVVDGQQACAAKIGIRHAQDRCLGRVLVQQRANAQTENVGIGGLGQKIVGAAFQTVDLGVGGFLHRQHQDRDITAVDVHANTTAKLIAANTGQVIIEDEQIGGTVID